jgi:hypothetical protein
VPEVVEASPMTLIENPYSLPEAYVNAVSKQRVPQPRRISVTELLSPARLRALWLAHYQDIVLVAGDNDHDLFHGSAIHAYLEQHAGGSAIVESQLTHRIGDWTVHGTPDHLDWLAFGEEGLLIDWKSCKVRALQYDKEEWAQQINRRRVCRTARTRSGGNAARTPCILGSRGRSGPAW